MKQKQLAVCAWAFLLPAVAIAGEKGGSLPALTEAHTNASQTIRFRTPAGWAVETAAGMPEITEARGDGLIVRLLWREAEVGLDALHVDCMLVRLAQENAGRPDVDYEYDFIGGVLAGRRALDSAFVVHYDAPIDGTRDWRQRNVSIVGEGESVCVIGYGPMPASKKSRPLRKLLDAVMSSVELRPWH